MTVTFGFYNSVGHDRQYDSVQMSTIFDGIITDGIFNSIGTAMLVVPGTGLTVAVGIGRAWFNHTWTLNDSVLVLPIDLPDLIFPRIDAVVLEVNAADATRANTIKVIKGTPTVTPVAPTLVNAGDLHQYPLAYIRVDVGATSFTTPKITSKVGTVDCPFIAGVVNQDAIFAHWQSAFDAWFQEMKDQLTTDAAGHLQEEIDAIQGDINSGFRIVARQGGSDTDWDIYGTNNYTITLGHSVMQVGNAAVSGGEGLVEITYPQEFLFNPVVILTYDGMPNVITPQVCNPTPRGFLAKLTEHTTTPPYHIPAPDGISTVSWMAVGQIV